MRKCILIVGGVAGGATAAEEKLLLKDFKWKSS